MQEAKMQAALKKTIIPFFIAMQGCPNQCVFCNQHRISGSLNLPTADQIKAEIAAYQGQTAAQIAFYGGSFTALSKAKQSYYLQAVAEGFSQNKVDSIRISTRPDLIDHDNLTFLKEQGVKVIELGIQSFDASVLAACGRNYQPNQALDASLQIKAARLELGIQLMCGLPKQSSQSALDSLKIACNIKPTLLRIYPTLVIKDTPLADMYQKGHFKPQTLSQAVLLCADMIKLTQKAKIPIARLGLQPSISLEQALIAGPYHPSFGQLVKSQIKLRQIIGLIKADDQKPIIHYAPQDRSLIYGQKNRIYKYLKQLYPALELIADSNLKQGELCKL